MGAENPATCPTFSRVDHLAGILNLVLSKLVVPSQFRMQCFHAVVARVPSGVKKCLQNGRLIAGIKKELPRISPFSFLTPSTGMRPNIVCKDAMVRRADYLPCRLQSFHPWLWITRYTLVISSANAPNHRKKDETSLQRRGDLVNTVNVSSADIPGCQHEY